ncbi:MAG: hypothetical protein JNM18_17890, partial [Planctomycetaceae bacterium]|nr:hypothetical protein [Planctomycetaceae bacterium]
FRGEEAETQARELVHEFRTVHKLPAYTQRKNWDLSEGTTGRGVDRYGNPRKMQYQIKQIDEVAVLVGDFPAIDDPQAKKTLEKIKFMVPDCLNAQKIAAENERRRQNKEKEKTWAVPLGRFRQTIYEMLPEGHENKAKGPMCHAFITGNPLIPKEYFAPKGIDKLVYEMNKPLPYSLLNCPGKYTVKVATFTGQIVIDPQAIKDIEAGKKAQPGGLAEAADKAHRMCEALRAKGYEAYELHDRFASMVTVGSFQSVGTPRADGKTEIDPQIHTLIETFSAPLVKTPTGAPAREKPKSIVDIAFDLQAQPVEVPKSGVIVDYDRGAVVQR